jgi:flagellar biogenesis protein FliO
MPFIKRPDGKFSTEDKIKMFQQMGSVSAVIALVLVVLIETGIAGEQKPLAEMGLTAMIVVLAIALTGSLYFKTRRK